LTVDCRPADVPEAGLTIPAIDWAKSVASTGPVARSARDQARRRVAAATQGS